MPNQTPARPILRTITHTAQASITDLPEQFIANICARLPPKPLARFGFTNKRHKRISDAHLYHSITYPGALYAVAAWPTLSLHARTMDVRFNNSMSKVDIYIRIRALQNAFKVQSARMCDTSGRDFQWEYETCFSWTCFSTS
ncbi:hypothetical protein CC86DRAFT_401810 [Ophiobolus disseminans]|uniref:F-box domain-containing protein n=1 Tax=Ophiobolus disseminans TaxID=1469910 RepID=A0A6A7AF31_9PLEO|nr:hypothetical protein CC86DRAFT_401810 [Ophiobolus disseminans]